MRISLILIFLSLYILTVNAQNRPFIITVKTDNPGGSCMNCITIPVDTNLVYNYSIDWENDGSFDNLGVSGPISHEYDTPGLYEVAIQGEFPTIYVNGDTVISRKIVAVNQWGDIRWQSLSHSFMSCDSLEVLAIDAPDLSSATKMNFTFQNCKKLNSDLNHWDVSTITNMDNLFSGATSFNGNISGWDVSNVTRMFRMFVFATSFNGDLSEWNVGNVETFDWTFSNATSFTSDLSNWNVSNCSSMVNMFEKAESFSSDLDNWNVSMVTTMSGMFSGTENFTSDLNSWNLASVINLTRMFQNSNFNGDISMWGCIQCGKYEMDVLGSLRV